MRFEGTRYYSYGTVIANIISHKGRKAFVRDMAGFSVSTSKHQNFVWRAIPNSEKTFHVNIGNRGQSLNFTAPELVRHYENEFKSAIARGHIQKHKACELFLRSVSFLESAIGCAEYFGLGSAKFKAKLAKLQPDIETARTFLNERDERIKRNKINPSPEILAKRAKAKAARERAELAKLEKARAEWLNGGSYSSLIRSGSVLLRVLNPPFTTSSQVETSLGARIPYADAERAFHFAITRKEKGWHRNGEQFSVGSYQLEAINENGIVAGCHRISWAEIERFATAQGWIKSSVAGSS